jgi:hypothetical protein
MRGPGAAASVRADARRRRARRAPAVERAARARPIFPPAPVFSSPERRADAPAPNDAPPPERPGDVPHNVPAALSGFVGRARDLVEVGALLGRARLVTLAGPGGVGKTRLAREAAAAAAAAAAGPAGRAFPEGVWWVELAPLPAGADLTPAVAAALGVRQPPGAERPGVLVDTLAEALAGRRLLVVLDNCEHVVEGAAALADALRGLPGLDAAGHEPRGARRRGEWCGRWRGWPTRRRGLAAAARPRRGRRGAAPGPAFAARGRRLRGGRAVRRARARRAAGFALTRAPRPHVAAITRRLDGLPLALELAAAQVATLGVEQLATAAGRRVRRAHARAAHRRCRATARCARCSTGATTCSPPPSARCSRGSASSAARSPSTTPRPCAARAPRGTTPPARRPPRRWPTPACRPRSAAWRSSRSWTVREGGPEGAGEPRYRLLEPVRQYAGRPAPGHPRRGAHARPPPALGRRLVADTEPALVTHDRARAMAVVRGHLEDLRTAVRWAGAAPARRPRGARGRTRRSRSWRGSPTSG